MTFGDILTLLYIKYRLTTSHLSIYRQYATKISYLEQHTILTYEK